MTQHGEQELFDACVAATDAAAREALLGAHPDGAIAARVRRLLAIHDEDPASLPGPVLPAAPGPLQVGPYRMLERIGEGAIGEVWVAEQAEPVRRRVALKVIKFGLATRDVLARFEIERQTLALMTHPNIARILDAGTTGDGRPYFAMEYVPGIPLTRYCDERRLDVDARLALFMAVCAGVQHAHLRGVIHRDLKPSNILVAEVDGQALPKIIDFGIAKATTAIGGSGDAYTRVGHLLGTPEYMSPEQAQLSPLDIDARTDVYALGMILYELLTGTRPYEVARDSFDPSIVARHIVEGEIVRPSVRVAAVAADDDGMRAQARRSTPRALAARLDGDLDWIVLKALEKDRQRRYLSAADLAADLQRAASNEPVTAGPPTAGYRFGKFVRRHRVGVGIAATLVVATLGFGTSMAWLARKAAAERDRANAEADVARRVTEFTAGIFESANPGRSGVSDASARQLLDAGVRDLESRAREERAEVRAALFEAAGNAYRGLGDSQKAAPLIDRALELRAAAAGSDPAAYAAALRSRAGVSRSAGDFERAEREMRQALQLLERIRPLDEAALRRARIDLASVLRLRGQLDEAATLAAGVLADYEREARPDPKGLAWATSTLGRIEQDQGRLDAAEQRLERAVELHRLAFGALSVPTVTAKSGLAFVLINKGESARAEALLREVVEDSRRIYGPEHLEVGVALSDLGNALTDFPEKFGEAEKVYDEAIALLRRSAGAQHPELATALNNVGFLYNRQQRWADARRVYAESAAIRRIALGAHHPDTAAAEMGEAMALNKLGDFEHAEPLLRAASATLAQDLGADHWRVGNAETYLGMVLINLGRRDEARSVLADALAKLEKTLGPEHARTAIARRALAALAAPSRPAPPAAAPGR
ncbi:MAG: tetratricopeptide repeat protein [Steroidobacteraceae bacterium]